MSQDHEYGPCLSDEEYDRMVTSLYEDIPPVPGRKEERLLRRRLLDLAIDHRLGRDFPADRREALWAVERKMEKKRALLVFRYLLKKLLGKGMAGDAPKLAASLVKEYAKVLNDSELQRFFGSDEVRHPSLPVEPEQKR